MKMYVMNEAQMEEFKSIALHVSQYNLELGKRSSSLVDKVAVVYDRDLLDGLQECEKGPHFFAHVFYTGPNSDLCPACQHEEVEK
jgi:hypothetical protein